MEEEEQINNNLAQQEQQHPQGAQTNQNQRGSSSSSNEEDYHQIQNPNEMGMGEMDINDLFQQLFNFNQQKKPKINKSIVNINRCHGLLSEAQDCGYCKEKGSFSVAFTAIQMTVKDYTLLLNRGFTRCGDYYYQPQLELSCCACFCCRSRPLDHKIRKSHKKIWKRWFRFLRGERSIVSSEEKIEEQGKELEGGLGTGMEVNGGGGKEGLGSGFGDDLDAVKEFLGGLVEPLKNLIFEFYQKSELSKSNEKNVPQKDLTSDFLTKNLVKLQSKKAKNKGGNAAQNRDFVLQSSILSLICRQFTSKAKLLVKNFLEEKSGELLELILLVGSKDLAACQVARPQKVGNNHTLHLKVAKTGHQLSFLLKKKGLILIKRTPENLPKSTKKTPKPTKKTQKEPIQDLGPDYPLSTPTQETTTNNNPFESAYPLEPPQEPITPQIRHQKQSELKKRKWTTKIVPASYTEEKYKMYRTYSSVVHDKHDTTAESFKSFLCTPNLIEETITSEIDPTKSLTLGCFHMEHYLDDELMGVSVIDILTDGLSSYYFFFNPLYKPLRFGIVSALYEHDWVREQNKYFPEFKYLYLGLFIHDCLKMNYKQDYEPLELLCQSKMEFFEYDEQLRREVRDPARPKRVFGTMTPEERKETEFSYNTFEMVGELMERGVIKIGEEEHSFKMLGDETVLKLINNVPLLFQGLGKEFVSNCIFEA